MGRLGWGRFEWDLQIINGLGFDDANSPCNMVAPGSVAITTNPFNFILATYSFMVPSIGTPLKSKC
jgi:hypothetical protein